MEEQMGMLVGGTASRRVRRTPVARAARLGIGVLAASAMVMIGAGLGAAAALATSPVGASTAHSSLPPVNVAVTNNPTVNVGNLPTNGQGRLRVSLPAGAPHNWGWGPWGEEVTNNTQTYTMVNVSGPGVFKGVTWDSIANIGPSVGWFDGGNCGAYDGQIWVYIDGHTALWTVFSWMGWPSVGWNGNTTGESTNSPFYQNDPVLGGSVTPWCNGQGTTGYFWPPGGIAFNSSLQVVMQPAPWWPNGVPVWIGARAFFTTGYTSGT
jgi:hypothetical protein